MRKEKLIRIQYIVNSIQWQQYRPTWLDHSRLTTAASVYGSLISLPIVDLVQVVNTRNEVETEP